jgi:hypothetical protein
MNKDPMTAPIDDMQRIKPTIVFDIPGTHEVGLMDIVDAQGFLEIGIFDPFRAIRCFF